MVVNTQRVFVVFVPMVFNEADIKRIVVGALSGSICYWGIVDSRDTEDREILEGKPADMDLPLWCAELLLQDRDIVIVDRKTGEKYSLTLQRVINGIETLYRVNPRNGKSVFSDVDYDHIIQYGLFGKVVYKRERFKLG
jgi:hypothetical protein